MADITIIHPETGATATVSPDALEHHYRQSGWMTTDELADWQARLAERAEAAAAEAAKSSKTTAKAKE